MSLRSSASSFATRTLILGFFTGISIFAFGACASVIGADFDRNSQDGATSSDGHGSTSPDQDGAPGSGGDGSTSASDARADARTDAGDAGVGLPPVLDGGTYAAAQAALVKLRYPGPVTAPGSTGYCTDSHFIWRESDGTLHSWAAKDQSVIDYAFKQLSTPVFLPGDSYLPINSAGYASLQIYDTTQANSLITTLPYSYNTAGASDGVVLLEISGSGTNQATKVQEWNEVMNTTVDVLPAVVPTPQPPSSFGLNEVVMPEGVNVPYALYIINVVDKTTTSVTFDGAIARYDTLSTSLGLVVSYVRTGATYAIRLYQNNDDATRVEIGDEIANLPLMFSDSTPNEHKFEVHIARDGNNLIYASVFGLWSYGLDTGVLTALQLLGANPNSGAVPDVMCVIPNQRLLVYRVNGDSVGQIWAVPLASLLP